MKKYNNNIIKDINHLYELSQTIGNSLDLNENILAFTTKLLRQKDLLFISVWIKNTYLGKKEVNRSSLIICTPEYYKRKTEISNSHLIYKRLKGLKYVDLSNDLDILDLEKNDSQKGFHYIIGLGEIGFLRIHSSEKEEEINFRKLSAIFDKFTISIKACLYHKQIKVAQEKLTESNLKNEKIIESAFDALVIVDNRGYITDWNKAAVGIFGLTKEEAIGLMLYRILELKNDFSNPENMRLYLLDGVNEVLNKPIERIGICKDGSRKILEIKVSRIRHNNEVFYSAFIRDISLLRANERKIKITNTRLETLIQSLDLGILLEDENSNILLTNNMFCNIFDIKESPSELIGTQRGDKVKESASQVRNSNSFIEKIKINRDNKIKELGVTIEFNNSRVFERDFIPIMVENKHLGSLWQYKEITSKIKSNRELEKARKEAETATINKSNFLANMSHEIRTPLNAIYGFSRLLTENHSVSENFKYIQGINASSENLLQIINDILDFSKIESGNIELEIAPFNLRKYLKKIFSTFEFKADSKNIKLLHIVDKDIDNILQGDINKLCQILINLINNAIKFTSKGYVKISCLLINDDEFYQKINFIIEDTGIGIAETSKAKIFEQFKQADESTTRRFGGTGLGLAISKELVEKMGGHIKLDSTVNKGSIFSFEIVFRKASKAYQAEVEQIKVNVSKLIGVRILLVEDNEFNQILAISILKNKKMIVETANDGLEALDMLRKHKYDLILMDEQMPKLGGIEATRIIRKELQIKTPIIAITANIVKGVIDKCFDAGMNDFISKPFDSEVLIEKISKLVVLNKDKKTKLFCLSKLENIINKDGRIVANMLKTFVESTPIYLKNLNTGYKNLDFDAILAITHKMKPSLDILCVVELVQILTKIESYCRKKKDCTDLSSLINKMNIIFADLFLQLEEEINKLEVLSD